MQPQQRNTLADSLNSLKIDLKLIAISDKRHNHAGTNGGVRASTVHTSPKK